MMLKDNFLITLILFGFMNCYLNKTVEKTPQKRGEAFLNCYLLNKTDFPGKTEDTIVREYFVCYVQICNFPRL